MTGRVFAVRKNWVTKFLAKQILPKRLKEEESREKKGKREKMRGITALRIFKNLLSFSSAKNFPPHYYEIDFFFYLI